MTPSEALLAQGFPILRRLGNPGGTCLPRCCSFAPFEEEDDEDAEFFRRPPLLSPSVAFPPVRKRARVFCQAGNSMQLCTVGAVIMYTMLFIELKEPNPELDEFLSMI